MFVFRVPYQGSSLYDNRKGTQFDLKYNNIFCGKTYVTILKPRNTFQCPQLLHTTHFLLQGDHFYQILNWSTQSCANANRTLHICRLDRQTDRQTVRPTDRHTDRLINGRSGWCECIRPLCAHSLRVVWILYDTVEYLWYVACKWSHSNNYISYHNNYTARIFRKITLMPFDFWIYIIPRLSLS